MDNETKVLEFLLLGFSDLPNHQTLLFVVFLSLYLITMLGNSLIILAIAFSQRLHTPMYFFIGNLSLVDMCLSSTTVPRLLRDLLSEQKTISLPACIVQVYFLFFVGSMEFFLLAVMAFDRYVAICDPLRYSMVMSQKLCLGLVSGSWVVAALNSTLHSILLSRLSFCGSITIHHFFCDIPPLLKLSCSDTSLSESAMFSEGALVVMGPFLFIVLSYIRIISAILKIRSAHGRSKAFSTCSSHLTVVIFFYGTVMFIYFRPSSSSSIDYDRAVSAVYSSVTPMINPFIYSLRNTEVKGVLAKFLRPCKHFH
uniref:Olfactory receptor n=2 Tax=Geotrypetes seraphini TaxID=260995 RepID=A0A6P8RYA5_GEOSA|nr:olfactory receptor 1361-like isoform X1 [Geotrypetes seraphini]XP_033809661.1 olfactory receptor 1361-like isoform X1 [Geotrypetes seraphini]